VATGTGLRPSGYLIYHHV